MTKMMFVALACALSACSSPAYQQYEWYKDTYNSHLSNIAKIQAAKSLLDETTDPDERRRLSVEILAVKQICGETVTRYNSEASKTIKVIVLPNDVPQSISMEDCK